jgi:hypothetical protein
MRLEDELTVHFAYIRFRSQPDLRSWWHLYFGRKVLQPQLSL